MDFIIDGNAYLNVAINVSKNIAYRDKSIGTKYYVNDIFNDNKFILKEQVKIQFRNFCLNYLNSLIAPIANINRVHLVFDSKSWRKTYVSDFFKDSVNDDSSNIELFEYKGNRKKDDHINAFFDYFHNEVLPVLLSETGINGYKKNGAEGDDIIAYLCESIKNDIIIYTVDGDIRQLTHSPDKNIIVIYPKQSSKHKKLYVPSDIKHIESNKEDDFFSLDLNNISDPPIVKAINTLINKEYIEYTVDPVYEIFHKILRGDAKDNIPKINKITPIKAEKIIDAIKSKYGLSSIDLLDNKDETFIDFIVENIINLNKITKDSDINQIREHIKLNISIIRLNSNFFPEYVKESLNDETSNVNITKFSYSKLENLKNNPSLI